MNLSVLDRVVLLSTLPREGDYASLKVLTNLRLSLALTENEMKEWGVVIDEHTGRSSWKVDGVVDIPIGERATDIVVNALRKLNREKKLPIEGLGVYEKFIPTTE